MTRPAPVTACALLLLSSLAVASEPDTMQGKLVADSARWHVDNPDALRAEDRAAVVQTMLEAAGFPKLEPISADALWMGSFGQRHYSPVPHIGDLVFFSAPASPDDHRVAATTRLADVGIVTEVDDRGVITYVHADPHRYAAVTGWLNLGERDNVEHFHGFVTLSEDWFPSRDEPMPALTHRAMHESEPATADSPIRAALDGDELTRQALAGSSCKTLWAVRSTVLARHGYAFETRAERVFFASRRWYAPNPAVHDQNIAEWLTPLDRINLDLVEDTEYRAGCKEVALR